jgi:hypothetical protein
VPRDQYGSYKTHAEREAAKARLAARIAAPHKYRAHKRDTGSCALCGYARTAKRHA